MSKQSNILKFIKIFKNSNINNSIINTCNSSRYFTSSFTNNNNNNKNNEITELRKKVQKYNDLYYNKSISEISDFEYDKLFKRLEQLEHSDGEGEVDNNNNGILLTNTIGAPVNMNSKGLKVRHKSRMLSLQNTYSKQDIFAFKNKIEKYLFKQQLQQQQQQQESSTSIFTIPNQIEYSLELKYDGIGINLIYENYKLKRILTRGDGEIGEDITLNALQFIPTLKNLKEISSSLTEYKDFEIRGEVVLNKSYLEIINKIKIDNNDSHQYKNTRNIVSGTLRKLIDDGENDNNDSDKIIQESLINNSIKFDFISYSFIPTITTNGNGNGNDNSTQTSNLKLLSRMGFQVDSAIDTVHLKIGGVGVGVGQEIDHDESFKKIEQFIKEWQDLKRWEFKWDIDGIVIKVNEKKLQNILGDINRSPRWAFAYKFSASSEISTIRDIVLQVGKTGRITPVAIVDPIKVHGVTISRATLNNIANIDKLKLSIGSKVLIERAGDVIPKIIEKVNDDNSSSTTNGKQQIFKCNSNGVLLCPCSIGSELVKKDGYVDYFCIDDNCPNQILQQISWFVDKKSMNIQGVGPSQIKILLDNQFIEDSADLYSLGVNYKSKLLQIKGFSHTKVNNILESIENSKSRGLASFLCAISIPGIGVSNSKLLSSKFQSLDNIINCESIEQIEQISGLGKQTSESIFNFFNPSIPSEKQSIDYLIYKFKSSNLKLTHNNNNNNNNEDNEDLNNNTNNNINNNILSNKNIVITGKFNYGDRDLIRDTVIRKFGGKVQSSINSSTNILFIGDKPAQAKLNKAIQLNLKIIKEDEIFNI